MVIQKSPKNPNEDEVALGGVPPKATPISLVDTSADNPTSDTGIDKHVNAETLPEVTETSTSEMTLHSVPLKETGKQCVTKESDLHSDGTSSDRNQKELHGVPIELAAKDITTNKEPAGIVEKPLDTSLANDESTLPAIELTKGPTGEQPDNTNSNINLQQDLTPEDVSMNTGTIDELSEFGNLLNLDDDFDTDLPLVGGQGNIDNVEPAMDLEIAMDNARFIEENPIHGHTTTPRSNRISSRTIQTSAKTTNGTASNNTPSNAKGVRVSSPRGVIQITSHVLRKLTPDEKKGKKFKCEADGCSFTGYSRGAISTHYANSHPPCYCNTCGKVYSNPSALARHKYVHNQEN